LDAKLDKVTHYWEQCKAELSLEHALRERVRQGLAYIEQHREDVDAVIQNWTPDGRQGMLTAQAKEIEQLKHDLAQEQTARDNASYELASTLQQLARAKARIAKLTAKKPATTKRKGTR